MNRPASRFVTAAHFVTTISLALFAAASAWQFVRALGWGRADWGMTDWLIDYAGGFVRRGLPGTLLFHVASTTGLPANDLAVVISYGVFFAVLAILVARAKGKMPLFLIVSPVLLAAPAYEDFIVRKDLLGILLLAACLALHQGGNGRQP